MSSKIRRTAALVALTAGVTLGAAAVPAGASPSEHTESHDRASDTSQRTKEAAKEVVEGLTRGKTRLVERYVAADYVDNAPGGTNGAAALTAAVRAQHEAYPQARSKVYRVMAEGDLVFVHSNQVLEPGTRGFAVADVFRFVDGRIVEHWGARQAVPATTASGNDMFSTLSSPRRVSPDLKADPNETRATLFGLFGQFIATGDLGAWDVWVQPPYYQHSVNTENGVESFKEVWGPVLLDPSLKITPVVTVTDGDLIVTGNVLDRTAGKVLAYDISRVRNGKVVEHWDVLQSLN